MSMPSDDYYCGWCNAHWWSPVDDDHCSYCKCKIINCSKPCLKPRYRSNLVMNSNGTYSLEKPIKYCQKHYEDIKNNVRPS
jgi:hypothetical protein